MNCIVYFKGVVDSVSFTQCLARRFKGMINVENANFITSDYSFYSCTCHYKDNSIQFIFDNYSDFDDSGVIKRCNDEYNLQISYNGNSHYRTALVELMNSDDDKVSTETKNKRTDVVLNMIIRTLNLSHLFNSNTQPIHLSH